MTKQSTETPQLFRSLAADKTQSQARSKTAAREAEERWPLFKAVAPAKPSTLPAMADADKLHWQRADGFDPSPRRPSLSVPDVSGKMALSLSRMGAPRPPAPSLHPAAPAPAQQLPAASARNRSTAPPDVSPTLPSRSAALPAGRSRPTRATPEAPIALEAEPKSAPAPGLFARLAPKAEPEAEIAVAVPPAAPESRSLTAIFGRLEQTVAAPEKPAATRPSFLGRLGRR